jgi:L-alanine-DL-glutamate epimerase-like enolase superfamily enzyme
MRNACDMRVVGATLYFLPVLTRVPLKFGPETLTSVTCARVCLRVTDDRGRTSEGWGETPLSVQWVWPSQLPYETRLRALEDFTRRLAQAWPGFQATGHALEIGYDFQAQILPGLWQQFNREPGQTQEGMPWLAALVCCSAFDIALHEAYGQLHQRPIYETYGAPFLNRDLGHFLEPARDTKIDFAGRYPADFLHPEPPRYLRAWHLVGGLDLLDPAELTGAEPHDGHPVLLADWIQRDGLKCLKIKLRGTDPAWDYQRLVRVGKMAIARDVEWLSADFNCTVTNPAYVNDILDRLRDAHPRLYGMILYVEQPFPYELEQHPIDVRSVASRKPLFLDESAHDWKLIRRGRELGWSGVALKTCKTQTGAILSGCWAKAHGLALMVQDLTNPMLAQIPHVQLAARIGTIMGVETNAMQFYPEASRPEAEVHPGLYRRVHGQVDLSTLVGPGFGYQLPVIKRQLPAPAISTG